MTDQQINAAITELIDADPHWKCAKDYCNDLNAMHEAEKAILSIHQKYRWQLLETECFAIWHATARQRAEAFLRILDKWGEEK